MCSSGTIFPNHNETPMHVPPSGASQGNAMPPPSDIVRNPGGLRPCAGMDLALSEAREAARNGEVPVGAVILDADNRPIARASNRVEADHDASAHAELLAMRAAARARGTTRLEDCTLVVTLEPCPMCAAAAVHFRIRRIIFGAWDPKGGGVDHGPRLFGQPACLHRPETIGGIRERENSLMLKEFFRALRHHS